MPFLKLQPPPLDAWVQRALERELTAWHNTSARCNIESAIDDYTKLLARNRKLEETVSRLEVANDKLSKQKADLIGQITDVKQQAAQDVEKVAKPLRERIANLEAKTKHVVESNAQLQAQLAVLSSERDDLSKSGRTMKENIGKLEEEKAELLQERDDLNECVHMEKEARLAATTELEERLAAKEEAEKAKEEAERRATDLERRYLTSVDELVRKRDEANQEIHRYQELQRQLEAEQASLSQSMTGPRVQRRIQSGVGSVFGLLSRAMARPDASMRIEGRPSTQGDPSQQASETGAVDFEEAVTVVPTKYPEVVIKHHKRAHGGGCNSIAFSPCSFFAASSGQDGVVKIWTTQDGQLSTEFGQGQRSASGINCVSFTDSSRALMAACHDKSIKVWDVHTARLRFTMTGHLGPVLAVAQHPHLHNVAVSCADDRVIKLWSLADGICQRTIPCRSKPLHLDFTHDGQFIVSGHYDGSMRVFDPSTGNEVQHVERVHTGQCVGVTPAMAPTRAVSVGRDSVVCVSDVVTGTVEHRFEHPDVLHVGTQRCTPCVAVDDSVVGVGASSGLVVLLDMHTGAVHSKLAAHTSPVTATAWNPHCEDTVVILASADKAGDVVLWGATPE